MMKTRLAIAVVVGITGLAFGQTPAKVVQPAPQKEEPKVTLKVGDPAPPLKIDQWIKGEPVQAFEKGKVYVVEFWATWCGPCIANIPHLNEVQKKRPDLTVISVAGSERPAREGQPDKRVENLRKFVEGKGRQMDYRVAYEGSRVMTTTWMAAAGQNGIPCAFVVDGDSKIAWIGHPGEDDFEKAIDKAMRDAKSKPKDKPANKQPNDKDNRPADKPQEPMTKTPPRKGG
jgi:thiol-disulfide isomerase/thioredoxin